LQLISDSYLGVLREKAGPHGMEVGVPVRNVAQTVIGRPFATLEVGGPERIATA
jgi:hypothetical protein